MNIEEFDRFVNAYPWRYAKTYAKKCPHEYYVKNKLPEAGREAFVEAVKFIRKDGFEAFYFKRKGIYFIHGDYYYWEMGGPVERANILNRAAVKDYDRINNTWTWKGTDSLKERRRQEDEMQATGYLSGGFREGRRRPRVGSFRCGTA